MEFSEELLLFDKEINCARQELLDLIESSKYKNDEEEIFDFDESPEDINCSVEEFITAEQAFTTESESDLSQKIRASLIYYNIINDKSDKSTRGRKIIRDRNSPIDFIRSWDDKLFKLQFRINKEMVIYIYIYIYIDICIFALKFIL